MEKPSNQRRSLDRVTGDRSDVRIPLPELSVDVHRVSVYTFCIIESVSDECSYDLGLRASGPRPEVRSGTESASVSDDVLRHIGWSPLRHRPFFQRSPSPKMKEGERGDTYREENIQTHSEERSLLLERGILQYDPIFACC